MIIGTGRTASNVFVGRDQPATGIYLGTNDLKARAYIMVIAFTSTNKASMPCSPVSVISARSSAGCKPICGGVGATPTGGAQHTLLERCVQCVNLLDYRPRQERK